MSRAPRLSSIPAILLAFLVLVQVPGLSGAIWCFCAEGVELALASSDSCCHDEADHADEAHPAIADRDCGCVDVPLPSGDVRVLLAKRSAGDQPVAAAIAPLPRRFTMSSAGVVPYRLLRPAPRTDQRLAAWSTVRLII
jgi:hypothetical protein